MFEGSKLKIERAEQHIIELEQAFRLFVQNNPNSLRLGEDAKTGQSRLTVNFGGTLPPSFAPIIGDAVHNLRAALDNANWELRGADGGERGKYTKLPVGEDRKSYEGICNGIKTPAGDLPAFFISLEIFKGGIGELIYDLNELDIIDKHMVLPTTARSLVVPSSRIKSGESVIIFKNSTFGPLEDTGDSSVGLVGSDQPLEVEHDSDPTFEICFGDVGPFRFKPIIPTLMHLVDAVKQMVGQFEGLINARN